MRLTVNGEPRNLHSPPLTSLLTALREELDITSPKAGCHQGGCGACTVLVDRTPKASREEILTGLSGHVCRCTGYIKIVSAVEAAAKGDVDPDKVEPSFEPEEAAVLIPGSPA